MSLLPACTPSTAAKNAPAVSGAAPAAVSAPGGELLGRSTFKGEETLPWMPLFLEPAKGDTLLKDGGLCARIDQFGK
ncbi:MAG TPA: hypothetical protein VER04_13855, partial [Polyangiaceae bacterium]|nr:hypothetical protein [Polyangiaceae bacterium]